MKEEIICINSDSVNRYGFLIHITAMERSLKEIFDKGMPFLIGHDFHRPVGWSIPFGIFIESGLARMMVNRVLATSEEDTIKIRASVQNFLSKRYHESFFENGSTFLESLGNYLSGNEQKIEAGCMAVIDENIACRIYAALFEKADEDGLIRLDVLLKDFEYLSQGVFKHKKSELCLFAHEFFRRSQSRHNNFHYFFLDKFIELSTSKNCSFRLRLDKHMIGFAPSFKQRAELEFHYGPPYTDDISNIAPGISRYICNDADRRFYGISATEFYWKKDRPEITFEMEEIRDNPSPHLGEQYHCRYLHSIYKTDICNFVHFDGAMRSYSLEEMLERVEKKFTEYGRKAAYKKLFRLDGEIPLKEWKTLITHYMQGNPLVYEYFGLKEKIDSFRIEENPLSSYQKVLPFDITYEEGIKLMFSYHPIPDDIRPGRYVDIFDVMGTAETKFNCLEMLTIEIKNAFALSGESLEITDDITYIKFDDQFWNIPSIMHSGPDTEALLQKSIRVLTELFESISEKKLHFIISLSLAVEFNGRIIRLSSYGHLDQQIKWLKNNFPFDLNEESITSWIAKQRIYVNQFSSNINTPLLSGLLQADGVLFIKRRHVEFPYEYNYKDTEIEALISFPDEKDNFLLLTNEKKIRPVICYQIEKAIWSDTKENYFTAGRCKWLENPAAYVEIHEAIPLALYWSKP